MLPNETEQFINYDKLGRVSSIDNDKFSKCFSYLKNGDHASNLVSKLDFVENGVKKDNLRYKYDTKGNIVEIRENNKLIARYKYDGLSRIIREDNAIFDKSTTFDYDEGGNIIQSLQYSYTLAENLDFETVVSENNYLYPLNGWRDQLQYFNGERFIYDGLGNPTQYRGKTLVWSYGRQLEYFDAVKDENGNIVKQLAKYNYNANGIRTSKTIYTDYLNCECKKENCDCKNSFTTQFFLNGNKIIKQHDCCNDLTFYYGVDGVTGFHIKNNVVDADYYYKKNAQNDIIGIYSTEDEQIARYSYDAWGNQIVEYLNNEGKFVAIEKDFEYNNISEINRFIAFKNPFRYRSYYYDFETNLYYLNSRYYDSEIGRFINADDIGNIDITGNSINGLNLYAYCLNNPVNDTDSNGAASWWQWLLFGIGALLVVAATVVVTVASGGTALGVFGTIVLGAAKGALIGVAIGSVVGITGGAIYSAVTGADLWESILGGFLIGFGAGAIIGAVIGASISGFQVYHAAQQWGSTATRSSFKNMVSHFNKHVVKEGHQYLGNNIVEYTKNAMKFFQSNQNLLKLTDSGNYVIRALFEGYKAGGFFNLIGKIFSFF